MRETILILGGGFAGLWSALAAARAREEMDADLEISLLNDTPWHSIRVRNYEADLSDTLVELDSVLRPVGVHRLEGMVSTIDIASRSVSYDHGTVGYDRLIFALGSRLARPPLPGLAEHGFDVDTYDAAMRLNGHIADLGARATSTVLVIGGGLTGIETAAEMPGKMRMSGVDLPRVILVDHAPRIGSDMGEEAVPLIEKALDALGIERRGGVSVAAVDAEGVTLANGERIAAETVVWCAGMCASPLTASFPAARDRLGRLMVDSTLKVSGLGAEFAAGDSATLLIDGIHSSVMSCQHGRPMGRFAGHNAVCDLLGKTMLPLEIGWYATILDLGPWGAIHTEGWNRKVVSAGAAAKRTKQIINRQRIYPPRSGDRVSILAAATPTVQTAPARFE